MLASSNFTLTGAWLILGVARSAESDPIMKGSGMAGNNFVKIYRDALDCWLKKRLTGSEWTVLMYLASQTWGWHRASTKKSLAEIANEIGSTRKQVLRAIKGLEKAGLVMFEGEERRKHVFKLRPPEEYMEFEAKLVT